MDKIKLSVYNTEYHISTKKKQVSCQIDFRLKGDPKFLSLLNEFIRLTNDPISTGYTVTAYANLNPLDKFDIETGMKVARAKAESMAYNRIKKFMLRYIDFLLNTSKEIDNFMKKAEGTINHNEKYLTKF